MARAYVAWIAFATIAKLGAAASIAAALGIPSPLIAAVLVVPVLELSGTMPLTPGNVGLTSGAIAMALRAHGVGLTTALTTGIAFHAVETAAGIVFGLASAASSWRRSPPPSSADERRWPRALSPVPC